MHYQPDIRVFSQCRWLHPQLVTAQQWLSLTPPTKGSKPFWSIFGKSLKCTLLARSQAKCLQWMRTIHLLRSHQMTSSVQSWSVSCSILSSHHAVVIISQRKLPAEYREREGHVRCARRRIGAQCWINASSVKWTRCVYSVATRTGGVAGRESWLPFTLMWTLVPWETVLPWLSYWNCQCKSMICCVGRLDYVIYNSLQIQRGWDWSLP